MVGALTLFRSLTAFLMSAIFSTSPAARLALDVLPFAYITFVPAARTSLVRVSEVLPAWLARILVISAMLLSNAVRFSMSVVVMYAPYCLTVAVMAVTP